MSYYYGKKQVKEKILEIFPETSETPVKILDIGAENGLYGNYLQDIGIIDAIEIYEPYVSTYDLNEIYNKVFICNVMNFDFKEDEYDVIILGDFIEHISINNAKKLLNNIYDKYKLIIISVPYKSAQGMHGGNPYQYHYQDDLTHEIFNKF